MNEIIITINNEKKEKEDSFEAIAKFDYIWNNSWLGNGGGFEMTAYGSSEKEAKENLINELLLYQSEFVKALTNLKLYEKRRRIRKI